MKYLLFVGGDETLELSDEEETWMHESAESWVREMDARGVRLQGNRLGLTSDATTVRVRNDEVLIADGPFAETKEQIGGYSVIECAGLDDAVQIAAGNPLARTAKVEVRPYWDAPWDH